MQDTQNIQKTPQAHKVGAPAISFIVTAYNIPPTMLRQCIESILALSLSQEQREIIVVDDGSDVPVIDSLKDVAGEIECIRQPNRGLSEARNTGMRHSSGQYVQFVDGDDRLMQTQYEHCLEMLRHQPIDIVMFRPTSDGRSPLTADFHGPTTGEEYMLAHNLHGSAWGYIFRRDLSVDLRFTPGIYHEDEEFTPLLVLRAKHLYATSTEAYLYRRRKQSIMHSHDKAHTDKRIRDMLTVIEHLQTAQRQLGGRKSEALGRRIAQLSMDYLYNTITLTKSRKRLKEAKVSLAAMGLYPLPDKKYTLKYSLFRKII